MAMANAWKALTRKGPVGSSPTTSAYTEFSLIDPSIIGIRLMYSTSLAAKRAKRDLTACNSLTILLLGQLKSTILKYVCYWDYICFSC